jgi:hypothetical protein
MTLSQPPACFLTSFCPSLVASTSCDTLCSSASIASLFSCACGYFSSTSAAESKVVASSAAQPCTSTRLLLKLKSPSPMVKIRSRGSKGMIGSELRCCCCCCGCCFFVGFFSGVGLVGRDWWCLGREGPSRTLNLGRPPLDFSLCSLRSCVLRRFDFPMLSCGFCVFWKFLFFLRNFRD